MERAGQGADRIYEECVRQGKPLPDFTHTDAYQVALTLHGEIADDGFLQFLHRVSDEHADVMTTQDLIVLGHVRRRERVPRELKPCLRKLVELGVLASSGRGAGRRYHFSQHLQYEISSVQRLNVVHDRNVHKALLLKHVRVNAGTGVKFEELQRLLPDVGRIQIQRLLRELRRDGLVENRGETKATRWFPTTNVAIPE